MPTSLSNELTGEEAPMAIQLKCSQCGKTLRARDQAAGKAVKCPCGTRNKVPAKEVPLALVDSEDVSRVDMESTAERKPLAQKRASKGKKVPARKKRSRATPKPDKEKGAKPRDRSGSARSRPAKSGMSVPVRLAIAAALIIVGGVILAIFFAGWEQFTTGAKALFS